MAPVPIAAASERRPPSAWAGMPAQSIRLGMPQLSLLGLSEGWLLRECGAQHWSAVAATFRVPPERLEDDGGNRLYSSFLAVRLSGGPLSAFREGDGAQLHTRLTRLSRNRFHSSHRLRALGSGADLTVEMISALLKRGRARDNTSLCEGAPAADGTDGDSKLVPADSGLVAAERELRRRQRGARRETDPTCGPLPVETGRPYLYRPSPLSDFNNAGLLYFATYHAIVDRAEWEWLSRPDTLPWTTSGRDTFFFANLNPGDAVEVVLRDVQKSRHLLRHRSHLVRVSDKRPMAEVFTIKRAHS